MSKQIARLWTASALYVVVAVVAIATSAAVALADDVGRGRGLQQEVSVWPGTISFNAIEAGDSASQDVSLSNDTDWAVVVQGAQLVGSSYFTVSDDGAGGVLAAGATCYFVVTYAPNLSGDHAADLSMQTSDGTALAQVVGSTEPLAGSGTSVIPLIRNKQYCSELPKQLYVQNDCAYNVRLALRYQPDSGDGAEGIVGVRGSSGGYVVTAQGPLPGVPGQIFVSGAILDAGGEYPYWPSDTPAALEGAGGGGYLLRLSCPNYASQPTATPRPAAPAAPASRPTRQPTAVPPRATPVRATPAPTRAAQGQAAPKSTAAGQDVTFLPMQPLNGASVRCKVQFVWRDTIGLAPGHLYEIVLWPQGAEWSEGKAAANPNQGRNRKVDLHALAQQGGWLTPGDYEWGVVDITNDPYIRHRLVGVGGSITFAEAGDCP